MAFKLSSKDKQNANGDERAPLIDPRASLDSEWQPFDDDPLDQTLPHAGQEHSGPNQAKSQPDHKQSADQASPWYSSLNTNQQPIQGTSTPNASSNNEEQVGLGNEEGLPPVLRSVWKHRLLQAAVSFAMAVWVLYIIGMIVYGANRKHRKHQSHD